MGLLLALGCAAAGCRGDAPTSATAATAGSRIPRLAGGPDDPAAYGCRRDADCWLTTLADGDCCGDLCSPTHAYARTFVPRLQRQHHLECVTPARRACGTVKCVMDEARREARCEEGRCRLWREGDPPRRAGAASAPARRRGSPPPLGQPPAAPAVADGEPTASPRRP